MKENGKSAIEVDYDNINVPRIMEQIKRKTAREAGLEDQASPGDGGRGLPAPGLGLAEDAAFQERGGKARSLLLKIMTPFRPLIKLLILPVYEEQRQTVRILHQTNQRLDNLYRLHDQERRLMLERLTEYTKLLHLLGHNLVVELSKLKIEEETLKTDVRLMEKDFEHLGRRERALEEEVFK